MKNKALTYILLIGVGLIWYNVFMRVKSNFTEDEANLALSSNVQPLSEITERDTFTLKANYRDPFGGAPVESTGPAENLPKEEVYKPPVQKKPAPVWPKIKYYGLVRNKERNNPLAIVSIDGMQLHLRKGEVVYDEISLKSIARDSIKVSWNKLTKTFFRE